MASNPAPGFQTYPNHKVDISLAHPGLSVIANGITLAHSRNALRVDESRHDSVFYIPREDVYMERLKESDLSSYCPFKGTARYWTLKDCNAANSEIAWAYDDPFDEASPIRRYLSFYSDRTTHQFDP